MSAKPVEYQRSIVYANYEPSCTGCPGKSNNPRLRATLSSVKKIPSSRVETVSKQLPEWFSQFESAKDSATLTDDVKPTYSKTLVTGKTKTAIAEFAYCSTMCEDTLRTLEQKFSQPHAVVSAYLGNLSPRKSENIISCSAAIWNLVGVFRSLQYVQDLTSATLLSQAVQKLPLNLKEA